MVVMIPLVAVSTSVVETIAIVVGTLALVSIAYSLYVANKRSATPLEQEQLRAYHELMSAIVTLNRKAVSLHTDGFFELEQERYVMDNGSKLEEHIVDVVEVFHRSYYLITPGVREAVGDYVDYVTTYHVEGIEIGDLLKRSGAVVEAMRTDLGLETAFPDPRVADTTVLKNAEQQESTDDAQTTGE